MTVLGEASPSFRWINHLRFSVVNISYPIIKVRGQDVRGLAAPPKSRWSVEADACVIEPG